MSAGSVKCSTGPVENRLNTFPENIFKGAWGGEFLFVTVQQEWEGQT